MTPEATELLNRAYSLVDSIEVKEPSLVLRGLLVFRVPNSESDESAMEVGFYPRPGSPDMEKMLERCLGAEDYRPLMLAGFVFLLQKAGYVKYHVLAEDVGGENQINRAVLTRTVRELMKDLEREGAKIINRPGRKE